MDRDELHRELTPRSAIATTALVYSPSQRWNWLRYALWVAAAYLLVMTATTRLRRISETSPQPVVAAPRPPSVGRVIIPDVPRAADVRLDDAEIPIGDTAPAGEQRGCVRIRGAGQGGGDRVECRLAAYAFRRFELRQPGRDIDNWYIEIPSDGREAILTH